MSEPRECKLMGGPRDGDIITLTSKASAFEQDEVIGRAKLNLISTRLETVTHRYEFSYKDGDFDIFNYQGVVER